MVKAKLDITLDQTFYVQNKNLKPTNVMISVSL